MSKAFTKEEGSQGEESQAGETSPPEIEEILRNKKNYITPSGAECLREEVRRLLHEERPEVVRVVSWAASNGDRSENADYIYGKRRLREIDRRVRFLNRRLDAAVVIDPGTQNSERVLFGATVTIQDENGAEKIYRIVGIDETDASHGYVSWISPIGRALLQARSGDIVNFQTPKGEQELTVVSIKYLKA